MSFVQELCQRQFQFETEGQQGKWDSRQWAHTMTIQRRVRDLSLLHCDQRNLRVKALSMMHDE